MVAAAAGSLEINHRDSELEAIEEPASCRLPGVCSGCICLNNGAGNPVAFVLDLEAPPAEDRMEAHL